MKTTMRRMQGRRSAPVYSTVMKRRGQRKDHNWKKLESKEWKKNCNNVSKYVEGEMAKEQKEEKDHNSNHCMRNAGKEGCYSGPNCNEEVRTSKLREKKDHNSYHHERNAGREEFNHVPNSEKEERAKEQRKVEDNNGKGVKHGKVLIRCLLTLLKDLNVDAVIDVITGKELIDDLLLRDIREQLLTSEKIRKLVRHLQQRDKYTYKQFKDCLHLTHQSDLVKFLEEKEVNILLQEETAHRAHSKGHQKENFHLAIRTYYREMKEKVPLDIVMDHLMQDEVLDWNDQDEIRQYNSKQRGVDRLLQKLLRKSESAFKCFLAALRQAGHTDLADKLETTEKCLTDKIKVLEWTKENIYESWPGIKNYLLDELSPESIYESWPGIENYLLDELSPESIIDFFMEKNIFSLDEYEFLFHCTYERKKRSEEFLKRIKNRLLEAISVLLQALKETNQISMAEDLIEVIKEGATADRREKKDEQKTCSGITVVEVTETEYILDGSVSNVPCINVVLKTKPDEKPANEVEYAINRMINDKEKVCLLKINLMSSTGCVIEKSENGSVIIYLQPVSRCSYEKLRDFCRSGGLKEFVLNMLKEEEIMASLPQGETCINVQVVCNQEESFFEDMDKNKSMTKQTLCNADDDSHEMRGCLEMIRENIIIHFEAITDEIDPIFFEKLFVDRGILNKQFFKNLRETFRKRKLRAAVFLKEVLEKGGVTLIALIDALKEKGCSSLLDKIDTAKKDLNSRQLPNTGAVIFKGEVFGKTNVHSQAGLMWSCSLTIRVEEQMSTQGDFRKRRHLDSSTEVGKLAPTEEGIILAQADFRKRRHLDSSIEEGKLALKEEGKVLVTSEFRAADKVINAASTGTIVGSVVDHVSAAMGAVTGNAFGFLYEVYDSIFRKRATK